MAQYYTWDYTAFLHYVLIMSVIDKDFDMRRKDNTDCDQGGLLTLVDQKHLQS